MTGILGGAGYNTRLPSAAPGALRRPSPVPVRSRNTAKDPPMSVERLRNIAIGAHVDHGKTTLVDQLLKQSGTLDERAVRPDRVMDSNDNEEARGRPIPPKNIAVRGHPP